MHLQLSRLSTCLVGVLLLNSPIQYVGAVPAPQSDTAPPSLGTIKLPAPTGPYTVGTTNLILTDHTRLETLSPHPNTTARVILAQIYYPTLPPSKLRNKYHLSPYSSPGLARLTETQYGLPPYTVDGIHTNSYLDSPVSLPHGNKPTEVVIFSTGYGGSRTFYATYNEQLASLGYIVISMEHLYDVSYVDVPGLGEFSNPYNNATASTDAEFEVEISRMIEVRVQDSLFILRSLADKKSGLVKGVAKLLEDCTSSKKDKSWWWAKNAKVAMYGHSLGGATAAGAMLINDTPTPLLGGINLDGTFRGPGQHVPPAPHNVVRAPFLLWGSPPHGYETDATWKAFYDNVAKGWKRELALVGSAHGTFTDFPAIVELFGLRALLPKEILDAAVGTIGGVRATQVIREFVDGFMGWVVRGDKKGKKLLEGVGKAKWPEVTFKR